MADTPSANATSATVRHHSLRADFSSTFQR
jgi:hypothetical protein